MHGGSTGGTHRVREGGKPHHLLGDITALTGVVGDSPWITPLVVLTG